MRSLLLAGLPGATGFGTVLGMVNFRPPGPTFASKDEADAWFR